MPWFYLFLAAVCEVGWPVGMKLAALHPSARILWIIFAIVTMALSGIFLFIAQKHIPIGTAYAIWTGIGAAATFLIGIVFCTLLGILIEKIAYKPLRGASPLAVLITAIGVSYLLQSLAQIIFGSAPKMVTVYEFGAIKFLGATVQISALVTLAVATVVMTALTLFVKYTRLGRAMIAVSEDKSAAQLMGINVNGIITITFAIGSALAALAGLFYLLKSPSISSTLGAMPGIKAFTAAVIGGIGSIPGAMLGGILLGVVECISYKITAIAPYTDAIEFSVLIIILLVRPTGFLGKKRREKV